MVLLHQLCPFALIASQHSENGRSNPPLRIAKRVQDKCGKNH